MNKRNAPLAVQVLNRKTLELTQSNNLSEGLCFQPGLRTETDCQTCGYSQLRMNGLPGSYSQILINSRPVFSSVLSMYGLEMFPTELIERVEVIKGGGSVLYGSSAIAGTVNLITRQPGTTGFGAFLNTALIASQSHDINAGATAGKTFSDSSGGVQIVLSTQNRRGFDANNDGFSELPRLSSAKGGIALNYKPGKRTKIKTDLIVLQEERQGGSSIYGTPHLAEQSEYRMHLVSALTADLEHQISKQSNVSIYAGAQKTLRDHYTGIDQSNGYGESLQNSLQTGIQYSYTSPSANHSLTIGSELFAENTFDQIPEYDYLIDQNILLAGAFIQHHWKLTRHFEVLSGYRYNYANRLSRPAHTPRLQFFYHPSQKWQFRLGWAEGFRAPQAFEADMHIAFAGGNVSLVQIDPLLKPEYSSAFNSSVTYTIEKANWMLSLSADYFRNSLRQNFILTEKNTDLSGKQILFRSNGSGALFEGVTIGAEAAANNGFTFSAGLTIQRALLNSPLEWSAELPGESKILRTPDNYGFIVAQTPVNKSVVLAINLTYTGSMLVPHFAGAPGILNDELVKSPVFLVAGSNLNWTTPIYINKKPLKIQLGIHNMLNAYQRDFDIGKNRDSNFVYGPSRPRTLFFGIRI
jgi:outer membrane receptor for ferrienterochelin and colicins